MHPQRLAILAVSLPGALTIVSPWVTEAIPGGEVIHWGFSERMGVACGVCFLLIAVLTLVGGMTTKMSLLTRLTALGLTSIAFALGLLHFLLRTGRLGDYQTRLQSELIWPGFGIFLVLTTATALLAMLLLLPLFLRKPADQPQVATH